MLAEAKHENDTLEALWTAGKREALETEVKKLETLTEEDHEELTNILDAFFDPDKKPVKPVVQRRESTSDSNNMRNNNRNQQNGNNNRYRRRAPRRSQRDQSQGKENHGPRSNSRRKRSSGDKQNLNGNNNNNNNNNTVMDAKTGAIRKELHQVDANQNNLAAAN